MPTTVEPVLASFSGKYFFKNRSWVILVSLLWLSCLAHRFLIHRFLLFSFIKSKDLMIFFLVYEINLKILWKLLHQKHQSGRFRVRECKIVMLAGMSRGSYVSPPYLDQYGETDQGLKRGNRLTLCTERYDIKRRQNRPKYNFCREAELGITLSVYPNAWPLCVNSVITVISLTT